MQKLREEQVKIIIEHYKNDPQQLIAVLLDIQAASGQNYVDQKWAQMTSDALKVPLSKIYDVLTFYELFSTVPRGEYVIEICNSTPCLFADSSCSTDKKKKIQQWIEEEAGVKIGQTTADGKISIIYTNCIGACDIGPVAKIGDDVYGNLDEEKVKTLVRLCRLDHRQELKSLCQE
ncbi:MAG: NAD(P)H-dependent oxidoreductase subunit E [Treponema sp.]|nr:NAD(P)H-dependent oxidoreductase subunit E [Treponema sp.]MCL2273135.1 NAD(P)H-dependent oxidoreductase subunit E [Treponema sp.]